MPKDDKPVSGLDQSLAEAMREGPNIGHEVLIRVMASSNISHRAQTILGNITASFALFDAPVMVLNLSQLETLRALLPHIY